MDPSPGVADIESVLARKAPVLPQEWSGQLVGTGSVDAPPLPNPDDLRAACATADAVAIPPTAWASIYVLPAVFLAAVLAGSFLFQPDANRPPRAEFDAVDTGALPILRSGDGLLDATLVAEKLAVRIGGVGFDGAGFNGSYGGPVLRVHAGDRVVLHLVNHMPDAINLHFHGLRISPLGRGDNIHVLVPPGDRFTYDFRIPASHPPGLFWYHDHAHQAAEPHVTAGLSGALLIEGFAAQLPGLAHMRQALLVLKDWQQPGCTDATLRSLWHCRIVSINGTADWQDALAPGQSQLWRLSNQGANLTLHVSVPGLHMRIIGRDGLATTDGEDVRSLDILPASRLDVLVRADTSGAFPVFATGVPTGEGDGFTIKRSLGVVHVAGTADGAAPPPIIFPHRQDLRAWAVDTHRTVVFSENMDVEEYYINGKKFDPLRTDFRVPLGNVEEWTVRNATDDFHEFHIHQLGFQVTEINGMRQPFTGYVDDVNVPARGEVKLLLAFTDPTIVGHIMFHCHVLHHEDHGMMSMLEVYRPGWPHICNVPDP
jgi:FtsP/CotA-like multicopper oxidase with cupredoxin domain